MIDKAPQLAEVLPRLQAAPWIALDTEADSLHAYPERLCLMQISIPGDDFLVDTLANLDLSPLLDVLGPRPLTMHGSDYDLRLLHRTYQFAPSEVFDTMLAARLLGYERFGLADLANRLLGVHLEKGPQKADWSRRPLTDRMATYARNDTRHLHAIAERLRAELHEKQRLSWHSQFCARFIQDSRETTPVDPNTVWRLGGAEKLDGRGLALLRALWHWREEEARRANRPPFFVIAHDTLVGLARAAATGQDTQPLLPQRISPRKRQAIAETIRTALALTADQWPKHLRHSGQRLTLTQRRQVEQLKTLRDRHASALRIDPTLIASRSTLVSLIASPALAIPALMPWQRELLELQPAH